MKNLEKIQKIIEWAESIEFGDNEFRINDYILILNQEEFVKAQIKTLKTYQNPKLIACRSAYLRLWQFKKEYEKQNT